MKIRVIRFKFETHLPSGIQRLSVHLPRKDASNKATNPTQMAPLNLWHRTHVASAQLLAEDYFVELLSSEITAAFAVSQCDHSSVMLVSSADDEINNCESVFLVKQQIYHWLILISFEVFIYLLFVILCQRTTYFTISVWLFAVKHNRRTTFKSSSKTAYRLMDD